MLEVRHIYKSYRSGGMFSRKKEQILKDVSFTVDKGECFGIIGESGSGKSTLSRLILGIEKPDSGQISICGENVQSHKARSRYISAVFQDYNSSINPHYTVEKAILEPMLLEDKRKSHMELHKNVIDLLEQVGLNENYMSRYPHELSGGETQRVCIARAISTEPEFIVLDEAISSLDVSIQTQILNLLNSLKDIHSITYLFITHDIQTVTAICNRVAFFKNGEIVETAESNRLYAVTNEYSKKLLSVVLPV